MYNDIIISKHLTCVDHIDRINEYFSDSNSAESFFKLNTGMNYDAVLMRLQALGENAKRISEKYPMVITDLEYPEIKNLIRFRDYVSHHYEQLEHDVIFDICKHKLPELKSKILLLIENKKQ